MNDQLALPRRPILDAVSSRHPTGLGRRRYQCIDALQTVSTDASTAEPAPQRPITVSSYDIAQVAIKGFREAHGLESVGSDIQDSAVKSIRSNQPKEPSFLANNSE